MSPKNILDHGDMLSFQALKVPIATTYLYCSSIVFQSLSNWTAFLFTFRDLQVYMNSVMMGTQD